ncbi:hypothetical protein ACQ4PT_068482 [Festuca glaucescens]
MERLILNSQVAHLMGGFWVLIAGSGSSGRGTQEEDLTRPEFVSGYQLSGPYSTKSLFDDIFHFYLLPHKSVVMLILGAVRAMLSVDCASLSNPEKWTCFLNCILQCVAHTVPLAQKLLKDDHIDACPLISENFEWGQHQDAHEFLRCLLDKLDEASVLPNPPSKGPSSIVQQIFGGQLKSQLHCPECNHSSERLEPFVDLNLEVTQMSSVMDALHSFTKIEVFENFICDGCKCCVNMEKQFKLEQAPQVLVIQLKRFQNLGSYISKIQAMVEYQIELDLNPFMSTPEDKSENYDLYRVVEHLGVPSNGHYICYIRSSETNWFLFDDSKVMEVSKDRALESEAYLLFYVKQGSSPWFSTLLNKRNSCSSDSDEGNYSCSDSDSDEEENECTPETLSWCNDGDKTRAKKRSQNDDEAEGEGHQLGEVPMEEEEGRVGSEGEIQKNAKVGRDNNNTHAT